MTCSRNNKITNITLSREKLKQVQEFSYLGSTIDLGFNYYLGSTITEDGRSKRRIGENDFPSKESVSI